MLSPPDSPCYGVKKAGLAVTVLRGAATERVTFAGCVRHPCSSHSCFFRPKGKHRARPKPAEAFRFLHLQLPDEGQAVTRQSFQFRIDRPKLTAAELQDGHYLLRSNLVGEGWVYILVAILAYCLLITLRNRLQVLAPGLTPKAVLEELATIQMLDVLVAHDRWPLVGDAALRATGAGSGHSAAQTRARVATATAATDESSNP